MPLVAVSLKMYFDHTQAIEWCRQVLDVASRRPDIERGWLQLVLLPGFTALDEAARLASRTRVLIGAQDVASQDEGPFTGEVSGASLRQVGCRFVEVGHAERRSLFGETDEVVAAKLAAAWRHELVPILCVGESGDHRGEDQADCDLEASTGTAVAVCTDQLQSALSLAPPAQRHAAELVVAYEPIWAIGAERPAPSAYIRSVCSGIRGWLSLHRTPERSRVIYGGSAGSGLLAEIGDCVDGLFLGRSAHDPSRLGRVLDEARYLRRDRPAPSLDQRGYSP